MYKYKCENRTGRNIDFVTRNSNGKIQLVLSLGKTRIVEFKSKVKGYILNHDIYGEKVKCLLLNH